MPEPFSLTVRAGIRHTDDTGPFLAAKGCQSQTSLTGAVDQTEPASKAMGLINETLELVLWRLRRFGYYPGAVNSRK